MNDFFDYIHHFKIMELFIGEFDQFVDHLVGLGQSTLLIILNIDQQLAIAPSFQRSSIKYLHNAELINIVHIDTLQKLLVYLANLQADKLDGVDIPVIAIWELPFEPMIMSKLHKLNKSIIGASIGTDLTNFEKWI